MGAFASTERMKAERAESAAIKRMRDMHEGEEDARAMREAEVETLKRTLECEVVRATQGIPGAAAVRKAVATLDRAFDAKQIADCVSTVRAGMAYAMRRRRMNGSTECSHTLTDTQKAEVLRLLAASGWHAHLRDVLFKAGHQAFEWQPAASASCATSSALADSNDRAAQTIPAEAHSHAKCNAQSPAA